MEEKLLYSINDLHSITGLSKTYIYRFTASRAIDFYKPNGGKIYFSKEQIMKFLEKIKIDSIPEIERQIDNYKLAQ